MEEKKKNKSIVICIVVMVTVLLTVCILFATGVFSFKSEKTDSEITDNGGKDDLQDKNLASWMNYLLNQDITNIELTRSYADTNKKYKTVELTRNDLRKIFTKFMNYQIIKMYSLGTGFTFGDDLKITYTLNGNSYCVSILEGDIYDNNSDSGLVNALLESGYSVENESIKNQEGAFYYYILKEYDGSILDEFVE